MPIPRETLATPPPAGPVLVAPEAVRAAGGVRVAAYRLGGTGPPLLLAHATGLHAHVWLPLVPVLAPHFTVLALDLRGHGESEAPATLEGYAWARLAGDLLAVADHFGAVPFHALGHSTGGAMVVLAELARPGTVARAVLCEPIIYPPEVTEPSPIIPAAQKRQTEFDSTAEMLTRWSQRGPLAALDPEALRCYVEYGVRPLPDGRVTLKCSREAEVATYRGDVDTGIWARLGAYRTPTLVMTGRRDDHRRSHYAEALAAAMPHGRAERDESLGHFLPLERPREIGARAVRFLRDGT